jgi:ABC-type transport system involved in multi-copper enzyme maturation permease subunit
MALPRGPGPVFQYEMLISSRRWQLYAGRALLVTGLLAGLSVVWVNRFRYSQVQTYQDLAALGKAFFDSIMWVELILTLLAVPAATAGVICIDKMRGGLLLTLATDLSDFEIVFGKLASRLASVLGVLGCGMPVLAITSWMGGVDPWDAIGGTLVVVGLAILAVSVTLTFSVWATRPSEALMATYATLTGWLLALPLLSWISPAPWNAAIEWVLVPTHPFALTFEDSDAISRRIAPIFWLRVLNFAVSLGVSLALAMLCVGRIRDVTVSQAGKSPVAGRRKRFITKRWIRWPDVSLDRNPLLWRECHHSTTTGMARKVWWLYLVASTLFVASAVFLMADTEEAALGGGMIAAIGLLFVSATAAARLAEERTFGSLDVLLTTPLSSREIVEGKWWGAYRDVPVMAALAGTIGLGMHVRSHHSLIEATVFAALLAGLVLAYGAVVTSVGLASAVRQARIGRAIALSVTLYLIAALIYPFAMILIFRAGPENVVLLWPSPLFGVFMQLERAEGRWANEPVYNILRMALLTSITLLLARVLHGYTIRTFDRGLGRITDQNPPKARPRA